MIICGHVYAYFSWNKRLRKDPKIHPSRKENKVREKVTKKEKNL
jgi:hypothetical protein